MRKLIMAAALFGGVAYLGSTSAQQPDPEAMRRFFKVGQILRDHPVAVVNNPGVQKELKLDEEQVKAVQEKVNAPMMGFAGGRGGRGKGGGKGGFTPEAKERMQKMFEKMQTLSDVPEDQLEQKVMETFKEEL